MITGSQQEGIEKKRIFSHLFDATSNQPPPWKDMKTNTWIYADRISKRIEQEGKNGDEKMSEPYIDYFESII